MDIKLLFNNLKKYNKKFKINKTDIKIKKVKKLIYFLVHLLVIKFMII